METNDPTSTEKVVLACSVRHRFGASWTARCTGTDEFHLGELVEPRVELVVDGEVWSAMGAEVVPGASGSTITVRWWFSGGQPVSYALVVHARADAIDGDRFFDLDSSAGTTKEFDLGRWKFRSSW